MVNTYSCPLDLQFPESKAEKDCVLKRIEKIMYTTQRSATDMQFIKRIVIEENEEELSLLGIDLSSDFLQDIPWGLVDFNANRLIVGSTILEFSLTFKKPPQNLRDMCVNRVIELFMMTIVENLPFIKSIKTTPIPRNSKVYLHALCEADSQNLLDEKVQEFLKRIRESVKMLNEERTIAVNHPSNQGSSNEESLASGEVAREEHVEQLLNAIKEKGAEEAIWLENLTPRSMREIIEGSLANEDNALISVKISRVRKMFKAKTLYAESHWLFPFNCRKLSDLSEEMFDQISMHLTESLPTESRVWACLVRRLFHVHDAKELEKRIKKDQLENPYMEIACEYMKYKDNSKTLGDFLEGLRKFSASPVCTDHQSSIQGYIEKIECLRAKEYADMMGSLADFSLALTREDFERNHGLFQLRVKTNIARTLEELEDELTPGNQLWMMREGKIHHRSYSHVAIISDRGKFIHVTAPSTSLKIKSKAVIKEEELSSISAVQRCFVVRPPTPDHTIYLDRAKACLGIQFDYDASTANCETFCQHIHGIWDQNFQSPTGGGQQVVNAFTKGSKLFKSPDEPLGVQMRKRIMEASLILPNEKF